MADSDPSTSWREPAGDDVVLATIRDFAERAGAVRVTVLLDRGPDHAAPLLECEPGEPITISQGDENFLVPPAALAGVTPLALEHPPKPVPAGALDVDPLIGQVAAPIGVLETLVSAVRELARALGGRTVAMADFATRSGEPLSIAARAGEPTVLAIGDHEFEFDPPNG